MFKFAPELFGIESRFRLKRNSNANRNRKTLLGNGTAWRVKEVLSDVVLNLELTEE